LPSLIVADSGPLIAFALIGQLDLLNELFDEVIITESVKDETTSDASLRGARAISNQIRMGKITVTNDVKSSLYEKAVESLDIGEAESISLASRLGCRVFIDEKKGRSFAKKNHLAVVGTLGLLIKAKELGYIGQIKPLITRLESCGYRYSDKLVRAALKAAGE